MEKKAGCLLIHGFGGSIKEITPLAEKLKEAGYSVACPVLKGHTGKRRDLKGVSYQDWLHSARVALNELLANCEQVYLIGFSMGGLLALNLAANKQVAGVVTLNCPIYYWDFKRIILNIIEDIRLRKFEHIKFYLRSGSSFPLSALYNFRLLLNSTKPKLKAVSCPLFIAQALQDDTVRKSSAEYLYRHTASRLKIIKYYDHSGHLILWSKAAGQVISDVQDFLRRLETKELD
jgi:carboxylesterase